MIPEPDTLPSLSDSGVFPSHEPIFCELCRGPWTLRFVPTHDSAEVRIELGAWRWRATDVSHAAAAILRALYDRTTLSEALDPVEIDTIIDFRSDAVRD